MEDIVKSGKADPVSLIMWPETTGMGPGSS
jgi:hypothetical protein